MNRNLTVAILFTFGLLWPIEAEAGRARQITFDGGPIVGGVGRGIISPDGNRIAFYGDLDPGIGEAIVLFTIQFDGTELLQPLSPYPESGLATLLGDSSWDGSILVIKSQGNMLGTNPFNRNQIYRLNYDGTNLTQLTFTTDFAIFGNFYPRITNDASLIVFNSDDDFLGTNPENDGEIFTVNFDGTVYTQITINTRTDGNVVASSDFGVVVYVGYPESDRELFVSDAIGSFETRLTFNDDTDSRASVAGDGSLIAFSRNGPSAGNPSKLFTILPDGTGETQLTFGPGLARGTLNGDGLVMLKAEAPNDPASFFNCFLGPSDGSDFKQIDPMVHGLRSVNAPSDLDYSGTRAIFPLQTFFPVPNEREIYYHHLFAYDDTIGDTLTGTNVLIPIDTDASITFSNVISSGNTGSMISQFGLLPDAGANFGNPDLHYEYWTNAAFTGNVEVCFNYGSRFSADGVRVLKRSGDSWFNITSSVNTATKNACGTTTSLGEFVVAYSPQWIIPMLSTPALIIFAALLFAVIYLNRHRFNIKGGMQ